MPFYVTARIGARSIQHLGVRRLDAALVGAGLTAPVINGRDRSRPNQSADRSAHSKELVALQFNSSCELWG